MYGAWLAATELLTWIQLLDLGIPNLMTQRIGALVGQGDRDAAGRWFAAGQSCLLVVGALLLGIGLNFAPLVTSWAQVPTPEADVFTACFQVSVVANVLLLLFNGVLGLSRGVQQTAVVNAIPAAGSAAGFITALGLLLANFGLWALAAGFVVRAVICFAGGLVFLSGLKRAGYEMTLRPTRPIVAEILHLTPPMAAGNLGYLCANMSELVLVTTLFGPVIALVYAVTRRMADGVRMLLDTIGWAVYGGFAHLVASDQRYRAREILEEILSLRFACACLGAGVYVAVNEGIVTLLFGAENFGGIWLTIVFGVQLVVAGQGFLVNYLYRAAGPVRDGSLLLAAEAVVRVAATVTALRFGGLVAGPAATTLSAWAAMTITRSRLDRVLPPGETRSPRGRRLYVAGIAVLVSGVWLGLAGLPSSWSTVGLTALSLGVVGGTLIAFMQPAEARRKLFLGMAPRESGIAMVFIGTLVPDQAAFHNPAFNRAGHKFQKELIRALARAGLPTTAIHSVEPTSAFPRGRQLLVGRGRTVMVDELAVRLLTFLNVQPLKPITAGLSVMAAILGWGWRHRRGRRLVHCVNLTMPPGVFVLLAARLIGAKATLSVLDIAEPGGVVPNRLFTRLDYWMQRRILRRFDGFMVVSQAIADDFAPGRPVCRIEGGIRQTDFLARVPDRRRRAAGEPFRLVLSGTLDVFNGVRLVLDAAKLLPPGFEVVVAGAGPLEGEVRARAKDDRTIDFKGFRTFEEMLELYSTADLLLNVRLTKAMNTRYFYPSKMMEFLASGVPVLSTCTGHTEEEFGDFVYLLRDETPEGLGALVTRIASSDPDERAAMGRRAREYMFANKTWDIQGERLCEYFHRHVFGDAGDGIR